MAKKEKVINFQRKLGIGTLLPEAVSEVATPFSKVFIPDVRSQGDKPPSHYYTNHPHSILYEFTSGHLVGLTGTSFILLETITAWNDTSVPIQQIATSVIEVDGSLWQWRRSGKTSWSAWKFKP